MNPFSRRDWKKQAYKQFQGSGQGNSWGGLLFGLLLVLALIGLFWGNP